MACSYGKSAVNSSFLQLVGAVRPGMPDFPAAGVLHRKATHVIRTVLPETMPPSRNHDRVGQAVAAHELEAPGRRLVGRDVREPPSVEGGNTEVDLDRGHEGLVGGGQQNVGKDLVPHGAQPAGEGRQHERPHEQERRRPSQPCRSRSVHLAKSNMENVCGKLLAPRWKQPVRCRETTRFCAVDPLNIPVLRRLTPPASPPPTR